MKRYYIDGYDVDMKEYVGGDYVKYEIAHTIERQRDRAISQLLKFQSSNGDVSQEWWEETFTLFEDVARFTGGPLSEIDKDASK